MDLVPHISNHHRARHMPTGNHHRLSIRRVMTARSIKIASLRYLRRTARSKRALALHNILVLHARSALIARSLVRAKRTNNAASRKHR